MIALLSTGVTMVGLPMLVIFIITAVICLGKDQED